MCLLTDSLLHSISCFICQFDVLVKGSIWTHAETRGSQYNQSWGCRKEESGSSLSWRVQGERTHSVHGVIDSAISLCLRTRFVCVVLFVVVVFLGGGGGSACLFLSVPRYDGAMLKSTDDSEIMKETVDVRHVIPLKKQQGFLNILGQMISMLGPALLPHLYTLLRIVMYLGNSCAQLLEQRSQVCLVGRGVFMRILAFSLDSGSFCQRLENIKTTHHQ